MDNTHFPIISLSREDLESIGFDASQVDDSTMERLAEKLADELWGEFPDTLEMLAERFEIPRSESAISSH